MNHHQKVPAVPSCAPTFRSRAAAFTLIEISIVLVVIGLIVGGILVGQSLINAAALRAQVSQIERFQTSVNTFLGKYGYLPGDIRDPDASSFGFQARGQFPGEGDGNGVLESNCSNTAGGDSGVNAGCGELAVFWQDLSTARLIPLTVGIGHCFPKTNGNDGCGWYLTSTPGIKDWIPTSPIAANVFVYAYSIGGANYFAVSSVTQIGWDIQSSGSPGLTVQQAYAVDSKIDDGVPQSGRVIAQYLNYNIVSSAPIWAAGGGVAGAAPGGSSSPSATTCYDNGGNSANLMQYSLSQNSGAGVNCALSFRFQ